jgi:6-phosphogluconate dehydrogenase
VHIGLIGLGKMGNNMRARLRKSNIEVTGYDPNQDVSDVASLADLAAALPSPRIVWVMVPSGAITTSVITDLAGVLSEGDLVIEGGNSRFTEDFKHSAILKEKGVHYVDCGVSGGVWGLENGYGLMAGGDAADIERALPVFDALRPEGPRDEGFVQNGAQRN